jgi:hypothetical protein
MSKFRINTLKGELIYLYHIDLGTYLPAFGGKEQYEAYTDLLYANGAHVLCQVDKALCELSGSPPAFRLVELQAWVEGLCDEAGLNIDTLDMMNPVEEPPE